MNATSDALIEVEVTLIAATGPPRSWQLSEEGKAESPYAYLASHMEAALGEAYCHLLSDLAALFQSGEFRQAAEQSPARAL